MRSLTTRAAALALGVERKVLDNILAREARSLLDVGSRGRSRRIGFAALERIAVALILGRDLGVPLTRGLELAEEILRAPRRHELSFGTLTTLCFDTAGLHRTLEAATADVLEEFVPPRRGRPPRS